MSCSSWQMVMTTRAGDHGRLDALEQAADEAGPRVAEVAELLGQAGVHVVEVGQSEAPGEPHAEQSGFLVGVYGVVAAGAGQPGGGDGQQRVEQELGGGGSDADAAQERRPGAADDLEARDAHVAAEGAGDQVDAVAEFAERLDAVVLAEGVPRGSKNGSGGDQDAGGGGRVPSGGPRRRSRSLALDSGRWIVAAWRLPINPTGAWHGRPVRAAFSTAHGPRTRGHLPRRRGAD